MRVRDKHRVITVIDEQRLVVLGSKALFTKVGQLHSHTHMIGKRGGNISYLYRQSVAGFEPSAWTSISGEEKDS